MLKSILLGLDDSPYSAAAIELGIRWARHFDSLLVGLGIVNPVLARVPMAPPGSSAYAAYDELVVATRHRIEQRLEAFAIRASEFQVAVKVLEDAGYPADEICREAQRYDLIILGQQTHFHPGEEGQSCETLERVLRSAPRPVVAVPEKLCEGSGVLVAYDGSLQAARTLQLFVAMGLQVLGDIHVVSVDAESAGRAAGLVDRAVEFLRLHDIRALAHPICSVEPPGAVLVHEAVRHGVELMVMGAYGRPRFQEFLVGSVTNTAIQKSPMPLFLYH